MPLDAGAALTALGLILVAELPDKTFVATLVLATRLRPLGVWLGVALAFLVQVTIAVTAGGLLTLLPSRVVSGGAAVLFAAGAVYLLRSGLRSRAQERAEVAAEEAETAQALEARLHGDRPGMLRSVVVSGLVLFAAEWGDLSQLLTAGLAARLEAPFSVLLGAWVALVVVSGLAVLAGERLTRRVSLGRVRLVAGTALTVLAVISLVETVRG